MDLSRKINARGRNGWFTATEIESWPCQDSDTGEQLIRLEFYSKKQAHTAPIILNMPLEAAEELCGIIRAHIGKATSF